VRAKVLRLIPSAGTDFLVVVRYELGVATLPSMLALPSALVPVHQHRS
jgi:hypothetical protein